MSHILISASHIQRQNATNRDGYNMVNDGVVAIETATGVALIFEQSDWETYGHRSGGKEYQKLKINLQIHPIYFIKTQSTMFHHDRAKMIITGIFDWGVQETTTIKITHHLCWQCCVDLRFNVRFMLYYLILSAC